MWFLPMWMWVVAGAVVMPALYVAVRQLRRLVGWMENTEGPRERFWPWVVMMAIGGAVLGGMCHVAVQSLRPCHEAGQPLVKCVMTPPSA